jgi:V8-like Glu-specific endopeptidase
MRMPIRLALRCAFVATVVVTGAAVGGAASAEPAASTTQVPARHSIAPAAQVSAARYWTKARMESATGLGSAAKNTKNTKSTKSATAIPNPVYFNGVPTVGALFFTTGGKAHFCTASVVDSPVGDIILTAAHCVYSTSYTTNIAYVPEWHEGVSPFGTWPVTSITVASGWIADQNQNLDFAFLTVAPASGGWVPIQALTGGLLLGTNLPYNEHIHVIGYNDTDDQPLLCNTTSSEFEPTQIEFYCNNYWDGTSGGPWIVNYNAKTGTGIVIGDIGGYEQGGDYPYLSYSVYYSSTIRQLYIQAITSVANLAVAGEGEPAARCLVADQCIESGGLPLFGEGRG